MRGLGAALVAAALCVAPAWGAERVQPVRIASGAFAASGPVDPDADPLRPEIVIGSASKVAAALKARLPASVDVVAGGKRERGDLAADAARRAGKKGSYLLWVTPALTGVRGLEEGLLREPARLRLDVDFRVNEKAKEAGKRWFSLWALPETEPILLARVRRVPRKGRARLLRYVGPIKGWKEPGRGWVDPDRQEIVRAPAQGFPEFWKRRLEEQREAREKLTPKPDEKPVPFEVLAHGDHARSVVKPVRKVLRTPGELRREWDRLHDELVPSPVRPRYTPAKELIVVVYLGEVPGPGYGVQVTGVHERGDGTLVIGTRTTIPSRSSDEVGAPASPYVMFKLPRRAGTKVEFRPAL